VVEAYSGTAYAIAPLTPEDLGPELATPPTISAITRNPFVAASDEDVTISANIIDLDGTVASAELYYSYGFGSTSFSSVAMSSVGSDIWEAVIPGPGIDEEFVNFYLMATDASGNSVETPNSLSPLVYQVLDDGLTQIAQIQHTPFSNGNSIWTSVSTFPMDIEAVVMASRQTYDLGWLMVQDDDAAWSGIRIFSQPGDGTTELHRGDRIRITSGMVREDFGATLIDSVTIEVLESGVALYAPVTGLGPEDIDAQVYDASEAYESMFLRFDDVFTTSNNPDSPGGPFGEWRFNTVATPETGLRADDLSYEIGFEFAADSVVVGEAMSYIQGILTYSFGNYKLEPRDLNDIAGFTTEYPNSITAFNFDALGVTGLVDQVAQTITVNVVTGTDVTALVPNITFTGVSVSPDPALAQNFSLPVEYTCFAPVSGEGRTYTVTVNQVTGLQDGIDNESFVVYPNPASDKLTAEFTANQSVDGVAVIKDLKGNNVLEINILYHVGKNILTLDLSTFPNGLYLLQIPTASESLNKLIEVSR
jgi:hypothetical protein